MLTIPATDIREDVRIRCNLPVLTNNSGVVMTEDIVNTFVRLSSEELAGKIRSGFGDMYFTDSTITTIQVGQSTFDLSQVGAISVVKVQWTIDNSHFQNMERASVDRIYPLGVKTESWLTSSPLYRIKGKWLEFYPGPSADTNVVVYYVSGFNIASDLNTDIVVQPGWREWIVYDVCKKVKQRLKEWELANQFSAERDAVWENVIEKVMDRDEWQSLQVRDTRDEFGHGSHLRDLPGGYRGGF